MLVLFDVDDTLLNDSKATGAAIERLRVHLRMGESAECLRRRWTSALRVHFERYLAGEISFQDQRRARVREALHLDVADAAADEVFEVYRAVYEQSWSLFDDVVECLDALGMHQLGVVSNLETDALGAHRAGLHSIWLNRCPPPSTPSAELRTIRGLSELPRIVQELSRA